jgi:hypothetical protein
MLATNVSTPYRKRRRRHARLPVALSRDPRSGRVVVLPASGSIHAIAAPDTPWPGTDDLFAELTQATWEDAEWR